MGFLQNDTNNIILDAVVTDLGRQFLARNDGSFSIVKFAASDDEVDYTTIKKFGRTVGKEKIEKNTPVFESLTNQNQAIKYKLISISNPNLIRLPNISLTGEGLTSDILSMGKTTTKRRTITVTQTIRNEDSIDVELRDASFIIDLDNRFLQISGDTPDNISGDQRATYLQTRDAGETALGGSKLTLTFEVKSIPDSLFTIFGTSSNKNLIRTFIKIAGINSGAVKEFEVQINKNS